MSRDWKREAARQWNADPCGGVDEAPFGSRAFFEAVERERYDRYAPWLPETMGFDRHPGARILEVGCGLGTDHIAFARGGGTVFGIDLAQRHLQATRERFRQEGRESRLTRTDAERLPFRAGSFDLAYSFGVLHHTPDTQRSVDEIHRVLKPGGEAIVALYHRNSDFYWRSLVLGLGLLRGGFLREGYRRTMSHVERRSHSDAVPLVKVYSRRAATDLFRSFSDVHVQVEHFRFDQTGRFGKMLQPILGKHEQWLARRVGWYVIIRGRKSA